METLEGKYAVVRGVAATYDQCIRPPGVDEPIDVGLAVKQHRRYCDVLESLGLELIVLDPDDKYPDCCFVEDTAVVVGDSAVILNPGAPTRVGEQAAVRDALGRVKTTVEITAPATIDGGDVLFTGDRYFVGLTTRTNQEGFESFARIAGENNYKATAVPMGNILHLKSAGTYLGDGRILFARGFFDETIFCNSTLIPVSKKDEYSANSLAVNGSVIIIAGYPRTRTAIEAEGFETIEVEMSEFKKGGGSLTCLSIIF
ncbi:MAG: hypothetical protein JSW50_14615 [Candidatus Latescibacterota bacterium]|nr:MAG: hypothetical protein JSW50_14615 [Candidatus Latescibacterota bacterium]